MPDRSRDDIKQELAQLDIDVKRLARELKDKLRRHAELTGQLLMAED